MTGKHEYRQATYPVPTGSNLIRVSCPYCLGKMGISRWESWNGFSVVCPHCSSLSGHPWSLIVIVLASLCLNVLSFFMTMRPQRATVSALVFLVVNIALISIADSTVSPDLALSIVLVPLMGPMVLNLFITFKHQRDLGAEEADLGFEGYASDLKTGLSQPLF